MDNENSDRTHCKPNRIASDAVIVAVNGRLYRDWKKGKNEREKRFTNRSTEQTKEQTDERSIELTMNERIE